MLLYFSCRVSRGEPDRERSKRGKISKPWEQNVCPVTFLQEQITALPGHPGPVRVIHHIPFSPWERAWQPRTTHPPHSNDIHRLLPNQAAPKSGCSGATPHLTEALGAPAMWLSMPSFLERAIAAPLTASRYGHRISRHISPGEEMLVFRRYLQGDTWSLQVWATLLTCPKLSEIMPSYISISIYLCFCFGFLHTQTYIRFIYYLWITTYWNVLVSQYCYKPF